MEVGAGGAEIVWVQCKKKTCNKSTGTGDGFVLKTVSVSAEWGGERSRGLTSCHTAEKSAAVTSAIEHKGNARGLQSQRSRYPPAEHSDHISTSVNKLAAVTVTDTNNTVPFSKDSLSLDICCRDLLYIY